MTTTNPYKAGKALGGDLNAVRAAWAMLYGHGQPHGGPGPIDAKYFASGTLMAAAQAIDPTVNCRRTMRDTLLASGYGLTIPVNPATLAS